MGISGEHEQTLTVVSECPRVEDEALTLAVTDRRPHEPRPVPRPSARNSAPLCRVTANDDSTAFSSSIQRSLSAGSVSEGRSLEKTYPTRGVRTARHDLPGLTSPQLCQSLLD